MGKQWRIHKDELMTKARANKSKRKAERVREEGLKAREGREERRGRENV